VVPYGVSAGLDSPNPDSGEEWYHVNIQLFGTINNHNRGKIGEGVTKPWNAPPPGAAPAMDGFVTDYISTFTGEVGRQPAYEEYAQIMTGYTPAQLPVLSGIAREFGVFDHWFSEVPSQTFMNRSFWTAGTSSGLVVNLPARKWFTENDAETIFERLEQHGRTWKVYVMEPMCLSYTGIIHYPRLKNRLATHAPALSNRHKVTLSAAAEAITKFVPVRPRCSPGVAPSGTGCRAARRGGHSGRPGGRGPSRPWRRSGYWSWLGLPAMSRRTSPRGRTSRGSCRRRASGTSRSKSLLGRGVSRTGRPAASAYRDLAPAGSVTGVRHVR